MSAHEAQPQQAKKKRKNKHKKKKRHSHTPVTATSTHEDLHDDVEENPAAHAEPATVKRSLDDDDSEDERKVAKKKKKKNKPQPAEPTAKKGAKSIRQMKREKHAQRIAEAESNAKDALQQQCMSYLSQWKHDRSSWKFMKNKQAWLYRNKFSSKLVPDEIWPVFLEYVTSAHGNIKKMLLEDANKIISKMDECLETEANAENKEKNPEQEQSVEEPKPTELIKPDKVSYKRARDIIQHLGE